MRERREESTTFEKAFNSNDWKPIRNCPGRFLLAGGPSEILVGNLTESKNPIVELSTETVPDKVLTIEFEDGGGIISYKKDDGKFIHTLNTKDGFKRKFDQLKSEITEK